MFHVPEQEGNLLPPRHRPRAPCLVCPHLLLGPCLEPLRPVLNRKVNLVFPLPAPSGTAAKAMAVVYPNGRREEGAPGSIHPAHPFLVFLAGEGNVGTVKHMNLS